MMVGAAVAADRAVEPGDLEQLFEEHHALVYRAAYRVTGNASDAEDVLQSVFLRLLHRGHDPGVLASPASYLYRAAVNAALDLMRSRQNTPLLSLDDETVAAPIDASPGPYRTYASGELKEWLRRLVARLHPTAAEMFVLRFYEGKDNAEIAEIVGTTPGTVAVTLHRTRTRLEKELRGAWGEMR